MRQNSRVQKREAETWANFVRGTEEGREEEGLRLRLKFIPDTLKFAKERERELTERGLGLSLD